MPPVEQKKRTKKTINHSTQPDLLSKLRDYESVLRPEGCLLNNESSKPWRNKLALTLLYWADQPDSYEMLDFCFEYKIPRQTLYDWMKKFPEIDHAYKEAALRVGNRNIKGAKRKELDKDLVRLQIHTLDPQWVEINDYHAKLKNDEIPRPQVINVYQDTRAPKTQEEVKQEVNKTRE